MQLKAAIETLEMDISAIQGSLPSLKIGQDLSKNANNEKNISVKLRLPHEALELSRQPLELESSEQTQT